MKLLNHTSKYLLLLLLPLITIWAVIFYYAMLDEIYDSLDDGLENQKILILEHVDSAGLLRENDDFKKGNYTVIKIDSVQFKSFKESYRDTMLYMLNENDYEPVRVYESTFEQNDAYFKIKIITSMIEEDDLKENLAIYLIALYFLMLISIILLNNFLLRKIWQPFYSLMAQLKHFQIEKDSTIETTVTNIEEFDLLNSTVIKLTEKSKKSYIEQKHFIENASHELQTPLAISINKLELFLENNELNDVQMKDMGSVLDNLGRLKRLNKSLLLLSKIENQEFVLEEEVNFNELIQEAILDFEDLLEHREITVELSENDIPLKHRMNKDLAMILLTNLLKNAIIHGEKRQVVQIDFQKGSLSFSNLGADKALDEIQLFSRFKKLNNDKRSTGLGLAIAKAITEKYQLELSYQFNGKHLFTLSFP